MSYRTPFLTAQVHGAILGEELEGKDGTSGLFRVLKAVFDNADGVVLKKSSMNLQFAVNETPHEFSLQLVFLVYLFLVYYNNRTEERVALNRSVLKEFLRQLPEDSETRLLLVYVALLGEHVPERETERQELQIELFQMELQEFLRCVHQISQTRADLMPLVLRLTRNLFLVHASQPAFRILSLYEVLPSLLSLFPPSPSLQSTLASFLLLAAKLLPSLPTSPSTPVLQVLFASLTTLFSTLSPSISSSLKTGVSFLLQRVIQDNSPLASSFLFSASLLSLQDDYFAVLRATLSSLHSNLPPSFSLLLLLIHSVYSFPPTFLLQYSPFSWQGFDGSLGRFAALLASLDPNTQREFRELFRQYNQNVFDFWKGVMKTGQFSELQKTTFQMQIVVLLVKNSGLFLEPALLKPLMDAFFPMVSLEWTAEFVDFSALFFLPLIDRNRSFFDFNYHGIIRNCRKAFFFSLLNNTEIPTVFALFNTLSRESRASFLTLCGFVSVFDGDGVVAFLKWYLGCGVAEKTGVSAKCEEVMKEEMKESQLNDSEIEMAGEVLVQLCVNEACGLSLLSKEGIVDVVKCGEFLIELIESSALLNDSPYHCDSRMEGVLKNCLTVVKKRIAGEGCELAGDVVEYCKENGVRVGNGGIVDFCGRRCVVSLADLPSSFYQRTNEFLLHFNARLNKAAM